MIKTILPLMMLSLALPFTAEAKGNKKKPQKPKTAVSHSSSSSSSCCRHHDGQWAQFSLYEEQTVAPEEAVDWGRKQCFQSKCIEIHKTCPSEIILKQPGYYQIDFIITGEVEIGEDVLQFAIDLNGKRLQNGTFAVANAESEEEKQLVGQLVVCVRKPNSVIRLVNEGPSVVELDASVAGNDSEPNVTASLFIQKLPN